MSETLQNGLRTHRPNLDQYIFSDDNVRTSVHKWLEGVGTGKTSRAVLIYGPTGHGKTTLALALCGALGVQERDVTQINCANLRTLEDARTLIGSELEWGPTVSPYRVLILDECHQMVENAQQAFLTPLENLSDVHIVIGCTTNPERLLPQLRGRMFAMPLGSYSEDALLEILVNLPGSEDVPPATLASAAQNANGCPRLAIDVFERGLSPESIEAEEAERTNLTRTLCGLLNEEVDSIRPLLDLRMDQLNTFIQKVGPVLNRFWLYLQTGTKPNVKAEQEMFRTWQTRKNMANIFLARNCVLLQEILQKNYGRHPGRFQADLMRYMTRMEGDVKVDEMGHKKP